MHDIKPDSHINECMSAQETSCQAKRNRLGKHCSSINIQSLKVMPIMTKHLIHIKFCIHEQNFYFLFFSNYKILAI